MRRGFSLLELLVVMAVIAVLTSILVPMVGIVRREASRSQTRGFLAGINQAVQSYQQDTGRLLPSAAYTTANRAASALANAVMLHRELVSIEADSRNRPRAGYLAGAIPALNIAQTPDGPALCDRWGTAVIYIAPTLGGTWPATGSFGVFTPYLGRANACELWSAGPDEQFSDLRGTDSSDTDADNIPAATYDPSLSNQR